MGRGLYFPVVIIDDDHGRRWGHYCHHQRSMVAVAGWSSSNQHRLGSSLSSTSTVVIVVVGIDCGHCCHWPWSSSSSTLSEVVVVIDIDCGRCWPWSSSTIMESRSIVVISLSSLAEVVRLRASSLSSKAGIVIVCHRQQRNPGGGVRPMVVRRLSSTNWVKGLVKAEQVKCPVMGLINSNNMVTR